MSLVSFLVPVKKLAIETERQRSIRLKYKDKGGREAQHQADLVLKRFRDLGRWGLARKG